MTQIDRLGTLLADIAAHPDAAPFPLVRVFGFTDEETSVCEQAAVRLGLVVSQGVRYDTICVHQVTPADTVLDVQDQGVPSTRWVVRRRRALYVITPKGKSWLRSNKPNVLSRKSTSPPVPKFTRSAVAIATSPRDVFDLSDMPWRCKMPEFDKSQQRRVARFLEKRRSDRARSEKQPEQIDWPALSWQSPRARSSRPESELTAPSCDAESSQTEVD